MQDSTSLDTIEDIIKNTNRYTKKTLGDPSVKEDGVYDIDEDCLLSISNRNNNISIIALFLLTKLFILK